MPDVSTTCVTPVLTSEQGCSITKGYEPKYAFTLEMELEEGSGTFIPFVHYDKHTFGPFELNSPDQEVNFTLRNVGDQPLSILFTLPETDLFGEGTLPTDTLLFLDVPPAGTISHSFLLKKGLIDQEITNLSFVSQEGPQIVVSLRSSVVAEIVDPTPDQEPWFLKPDTEPGEYGLYVINELGNAVSLGTFFFPDTSPIEITSIFTSPAMTSLPGVERVLYCTVITDSSGSAVEDGKADIDISNETGTGTVSFDLITAPGPHLNDPLGITLVETITISNYQTKGGTILCQVGTGA